MGVVFSFVFSLVRFIIRGSGLVGGQRGTCNVPPSRGQRTETGENVCRHSLHGLNASMITQKSRATPPHGSVASGISRAFARYDRWYITPRESTR